MRVKQQTTAWVVRLFVVLITLAPTLGAHSRIAELSCPLHSSEEHGAGQGEEPGDSAALQPAAELEASLACSCEAAAPASVVASATTFTTEAAPAVERSVSVALHRVVGEASLWRGAPKTSPPGRV